MNCKYRYKGNLIGTLDDLYRYLDKNQSLYNDIEDIIFSASPRQTSQVNSLSTIKEKLKENFVVSTGFEEDGGFRGENNEFAICEFLDNSGEAMIKNLYSIKQGRI